MDSSPKFLYCIKFNVQSFSIVIPVVCLMRLVFNSYWVYWNHVSCINHAALAFNPWTTDWLVLKGDGFKRVSEMNCEENVNGDQPLPPSLHINVYYFNFDCFESCEYLNFCCFSCLWYFSLLCIILVDLCLLSLPCCEHCVIVLSSM